MSRVALVTGGSRGIGAACAVLAAQEGWSVAVNYTQNSLGARPGLDDTHASWLHAMRTSPTPLLCADVPSGASGGFLVSGSLAP